MPRSAVRSVQALLALAAAIVLLGPAGRTAAAVTTDTSCTQQTFDTLTVKTCLTITGGGDFVQSAVAQATVLSGDGTLDEELAGPEGANDPMVDMHSGFHHESRGGTLIIDWCPDRHVQHGTYGATTQRLKSDGTAQLVGHATVDVPI